MPKPSARSIPSFAFAGNRAMIRRGKGHAVVHERHHWGCRAPSLLGPLVPTACGWPYRRDEIRRDGAAKRADAGKGSWVDANSLACYFS
jgi:hypothetical protein